MTGGFWDERYRGDGYVYGVEPNLFLVAQAHRLVPGARVLLPGDGEGRNGVWLADQGMRVVSVDGSATGLAKARQLASERGVEIRTEQADLVDWSWPVAGVDAVVSLFLHLGASDRSVVHRGMSDSLRPGGVLILEAFRPEQLRSASGGPKDPEMLYTAAQMREDFADLEIVLLDEVISDLREGSLHDGPGATLRLVAIKR